MKSPYKHVPLLLPNSLKSPYKHEPETTTSIDSLLSRLRTRLWYSLSEENWKINGNWKGFRVEILEEKFFKNNFVSQNYQNNKSLFNLEKMLIYNLITYKIACN